MAPAVRLSALGIRFNKKELTELEKVGSDGAWDEEEHDFANGEEISQCQYDNDLEWERDAKKTKMTVNTELTMKKRKKKKRKKKKRKKKKRKKTKRKKKRRRRRGGVWR